MKMKKIKVPVIRLKNSEKKLLAKKLIWDDEEIDRIELMHKTKTISIAASVALNNAVEIMSRRTWLPVKELLKAQFKIANANLQWLKRKVEEVKTKTKK
jgi:hypothetical protein